MIGPDGCKAALLQNMSRAGEEEVGVETGKKGNVQKHCLARHLVSTGCDIPVMPPGTLKQVVKPPPTKRANL